MFGRAGTNGSLARGHLLYTATQARQLKDPSLQCFATQGGSENCRRKQMLHLLGSSEPTVSGVACCDICSGLVVPSTRLDVLQPTAVRRPRKPKCVRHITNDVAEALKQTLLQERENFLTSVMDTRCLQAELRSRT